MLGFPIDSPISGLAAGQLFMGKRVLKSLPVRATLQVARLLVS
jgi:hypothetical protein